MPHPYRSIRVVTSALFVFAVLGPHEAARVASAQPTTQPFTFSILGHTLPEMRHGAVAWGDYDGDGDLDVFLAGIALPGTREAGEMAVYRNDGRDDEGRALFTLVQALPPLVYGAAAWGDYDGDGDLDLAVQGSATLGRPYQPETRLYRNDGGAFAEVPAGLVGLHSGAVAWGDYDGDGDLDLLTTGEEAPDRYRTLLYRNEAGPGGGRAFTPQETALPPTGYGDAAWGDYDGDGDLDLALSGATGAGFTTAVYRNDGQGGARTFTALAAALEPGVHGSLDWGDYDGDGDLDLLTTGGRYSTALVSGQTRIYRNDGQGRFTALAAELVGSLAGEATWGDYDDDGDLDVLVLGREEVIGRQAARLYRNEGQDRFVLGSLFVGVFFAAADWGDYDGDGDLDLLTMGYRPGAARLTTLYENRRLPMRPPPEAPARLHADVEADAVTLSWDVPLLLPDVTFNLRVGTTPGGADVVAAMADPATGWRYLAAPGNAGRRTSWRLERLAPGTYYWSVQALNGSFAGSGFSDEGRFTVDAGVGTGVEEEALPDRFRVHAAYPNPFSRSATLRYDLPAAADVTLTVYNVLGEVVYRAQHPDAPAGTHAFAWDGADASGAPVSAGLYVYTLQAGATRATGTLVRLK